MNKQTKISAFWGLNILLGRKGIPTIKKVKTLCNIFCDKFSGREIEREGIKRARVGGPACDCSVRLESPLGEVHLGGGVCALQVSGVNVLWNKWAPSGVLKVALWTRIIFDGD